MLNSNKITIFMLFSFIYSSYSEYPTFLMLIDLFHMHIFSLVSQQYLFHLSPDTFLRRNSSSILAEVLAHLSYYIRDTYSSKSDYICKTHSVSSTLLLHLISEGSHKRRNNSRKPVCICRYHARGNCLYKLQLN